MCCPGAGPLSNDAPSGRRGPFSSIQPDRVEQLGDEPPACAFRCHFLNPRPSLLLRPTPSQITSKKKAFPFFLSSSFQPSISLFLFFFLFSCFFCRLLEVLVGRNDSRTPQHRHPPFTYVAVLMYSFPLQREFRREPVKVFSIVFLFLFPFSAKKPKLFPDSLERIRLASSLGFPGLGNVD
jgi:hypothetical protein